MSYDISGGSAFESALPDLSRSTKYALRVPFNVNEDLKKMTDQINPDELSGEAHKQCTFADVPTSGQHHERALPRKEIQLRSRQNWNKAFYIFSEKY